MNPYLDSLDVVWCRPTCVFINDHHLGELAHRVRHEDFPIPSWTEPVFPANSDEIFVNFIGVGNAINFAFSDFDTRQTFTTSFRGQEWHGAFGMWACLKRALDRGADFKNLDWLTSLSDSDASALFLGSSEIPLLRMRIEILHEIGRVLSANYQGSFWYLFQNCRFFAFGREGLIETLINNFPSFKDESYHRLSGVTLEFHKRAQLMGMMYQGRALKNSELPSLQDYESLGPIADYSVPNALRLAGVLEYTDSLEASISNGEIIEKDSVAEQEIRAQTVHAQVALLAQVNETRPSKINYLALDYKLWQLGRRSHRQHHLTKTHAY
jgi:Potential Queuosine, Q, salvage protein family